MSSFFVSSSSASPKYAKPKETILPDAIRRLQELLVSDWRIDRLLSSLQLAAHDDVLDNSIRDIDLVVFDDILRSEDKVLSTEPLANAALSVSTKPQRSSEELQRILQERRLQRTAAVNAINQIVRKRVLPKPRWRWLLSGYEKVPNEALSVLKGKPLFRATVHAVRFMIRTSMVVLNDKLATSQLEANETAAALKLYSQVAQSWLSRLLNRPIKSCYEEGVDLDYAHGYHTLTPLSPNNNKHNNNAITSNNENTIPSTQTTTASSLSSSSTTVTCCSRSRSLANQQYSIIQLKIRIKTLLDCLENGLAPEGSLSAIPTPLLTFLNKITCDGTYFPSNYLISTEAASVTIGPLGSTRWVRPFNLNATTDEDIQDIYTCLRNEKTTHSRNGSENGNRSRSNSRNGIRPRNNSSHPIKSLSSPVAYEPPEALETNENLASNGTVGSLPTPRSTGVPSLTLPAGLIGNTGTNFSTRPRIISVAPNPVSIYGSNAVGDFTRMESLVAVYFIIRTLITGILVNPTKASLGKVRTSQGAKNLQILSSFMYYLMNKIFMDMVPSWCGTPFSIGSKGNYFSNNHASKLAKHKEHLRLQYVYAMQAIWMPKPSPSLLTTFSVTHMTGPNVTSAVPNTINELITSKPKGLQSPPLTSFSPQQKTISSPNGTHTEAVAVRLGDPTNAPGNPSEDMSRVPFPSLEPDPHGRIPNIGINESYEIGLAGVLLPFDYFTATPHLYSITKDWMEEYETRLRVWIARMTKMILDQKTKTEEG